VTNFSYSKGLDDLGDGCFAWMQPDCGWGWSNGGTRLLPGDVIGSGTVPTGCLFEHHTTHPETFRGWLARGDEVRLVVEGLGEIRNRVTPTRRLHPLSTGA